MISKLIWQADGSMAFAVGMVTPDTPISYVITVHGRTVKARAIYSAIHVPVAQDATSVAEAIELCNEDFLQEQQRQSVEGRIASAIEEFKESLNLRIHVSHSDAYSNPPSVNVELLSNDETITEAWSS